MLGIIIDAVILAAAIWIVARHEADFEWWRLVVVSLVIGVLGELALYGVESGVEALGLTGTVAALAELGLWAVLYLGVSAWIISQFLYVMFRDAVIASIIYLVAKIVIQLAFVFALGAMLTR